MLAGHGISYQQTHNNEGVEHASVKLQQAHNYYILVANALEICDAIILDVCGSIAQMQIGTSLETSNEDIRSILISM
jgi:hypothetical protein